VTALGQGTRLGLALVSLAAAMHNIWRVLLLDPQLRYLLISSRPKANSLNPYLFL
jgi:hypothetical protein